MSTPACLLQVTVLMGAVCARQILSHWIMSWLADPNSNTYDATADVVMLYDAAATPEDLAVYLESDEEGLFDLRVWDVPSFNFRSMYLDVLRVSQ